MDKRFLCIWLPWLSVNRMIKHYPEMEDKPFVLYEPRKGRMVITEANEKALGEGIMQGQVLADARAILPDLNDAPDDLEASQKLLLALAEWCLRFSPVVAVLSPNNIMLDISGCAHLWGGEPAYLHYIVQKFLKGGYMVKAGIADTIGAAWALSHYGKSINIAPKGELYQVLQDLPPAALRLEKTVLSRMKKLGFRTIGQFMSMPKPMLRRRFGDSLILALGQTLGSHPEILETITPEMPYQERLPSLEGIKTAPGIEIAVRKLLDKLCARLSKEGKGLRNAVLKGFRVDGNIQQMSIGTSRASNNPSHLFKLFALKIPHIEPALGIELFVLEASLVEEVTEPQEVLWGSRGSRAQIAEVLDTIAGKIGMGCIHRYLPQEHHWPERSIKKTYSLDENPTLPWPKDKMRPLHLLEKPEPISVMVVLPDYPPLSFTHKKRVYRLVKSEGPERIEQEWWIEDGRPRDYYRVEDENGSRYWLFRSGVYDKDDPEWYLHGFFA